MAAQNQGSRPGQPAAQGAHHPNRPTGVRFPGEKITAAQLRRILPTPLPSDRDLFDAYITTQHSHRSTQS